MNPGGVLFLCTHNSCRSQMAEAFARRVAPKGMTVASAGSEPVPVHPLATAVLSEFGIDISSMRSKPVAEFAGTSFDVVVTLCEESKETCPIFPGNPATVHWDIPDPAAFEGKDAIGRFRDTARTIESLVNDLFNKGYISAFIQQKKNMENVLDSLSEGVIAHDLKRRIFFFSAGAQRLTGLLGSDVLGRDCNDVFDGSFCGGACASEDGCINPERIARMPYTTIHEKKDGTSIEIEITRLPLKDEAGRVIGVVASLRDKTRLRRHIQQQLAKTEEFHGIIGRDITMQLVFDLIRDLSDSDFSVVINGESGTGKELVARAIHAESRRVDRLFVPINCGALPEGTLESELFGHVRGAFTGAIRDKKGRFELADGGTIFLDEVGELPLSTQVKLLRVLQEGTFEPVGSERQKKVDVRIICATNHNLKDLVAKGAFREDLYYRLAVVPIDLAPLRDRRNDIDLLAARFLADVAEKLGRKNMRFSDEAQSILRNFSWPGNVRQLQNAIQFAMVKCRSALIGAEHLPPEIAAGAPAAAAAATGGAPGPGPAPAGSSRRHKLSFQAVEVALAKSGGNKAKAARMLGVGRATLYNFISEHNLQTPVI